MRKSPKRRKITSPILTLGKQRQVKSWDIAIGGQTGTILEKSTDTRRLRSMVSGVPIANAFCPTGPGGGVDPGCPGGLSAALSEYEKAKGRGKLLLDNGLSNGGYDPSSPPKHGYPTKRDLVAGLVSAWLDGKRLKFTQSDLDPTERSLGHLGATKIGKEGQTVKYDHKIHRPSQTSTKQFSTGTGVAVLSVGWAIENDGITFLLQPAEVGELTGNVFCATGEGGGVKPDCPAHGSSGKTRSVVSETNHNDAEILLTQGIRPDFKRERNVTEYAPGAGLERGGLYVGTEKSFSKGSLGKVRLHLDVHDDTLEVPQEMRQLGYAKGKTVAGKESLDYVLDTENGAVTQGELPPSVFKKVEVYDNGKWVTMTPQQYLSSRDVKNVPRLPSMKSYEAELRKRADELSLSEKNIQQLLTDYNRANLSDKQFYAQDIGLVQ